MSKLNTSIIKATNKSKFMRDVRFEIQCTFGLCRQNGSVFLKKKIEIGSKKHFDTP